MLSSVLGAEDTGEEDQVYLSVCLSIYLWFSPLSSVVLNFSLHQNPLCPSLQPRFLYRYPTPKSFWYSRLEGVSQTLHFPRRSGLCSCYSSRNHTQRTSGLGGMSPSFYIDSVVLLYCQCLEYIWTEQKTKYKVFCFDKGEWSSFFEWCYRLEGKWQFYSKVEEFLSSGRYREGTVYTQRQRDFFPT